jgi:hypothetical protein
LGASLLLLCLAAHLTADLAWLYQRAAGDVQPAAASVPGAARAPADPHGEADVPAAALAAACLALVLLVAALPPPVVASLRPPLLHPPAPQPR